MPATSSSARAHSAFINHGVRRFGISGAGMLVSQCARFAWFDWLEIIVLLRFSAIGLQSLCRAVPLEPWFNACIIQIRPSHVRTALVPLLADLLRTGGPQRHVWGGAVVRIRG